MGEPPSLNAPSGSSDSVFVYGGLMQGFGLHHYVAFAAFVARATTRGRLYVVGQYPGMTDGDGVVHGEVYRFGDIAVALEVLDEVEDYDPLDPDGSPYVRALRAVVTEDGKTLLAWTYLYNQDVKGLTPISSGDWRAR